MTAGASNIVVIPEWFLDAIPTDTALGWAYESILPRLRGVLKLAIARLYARYGVCQEPNTDLRCTWRQGFVTLEAEVPCAWVVIILDSHFLSPVRLLAALLPALAAGVGTVLTIRLRQPGARAVANGKDWSPALLAALELAGQEYLASCSTRQAGSLLVGLIQEHPAGTIVVLGEQARRFVSSLGLEHDGSLVYWTPRCPLSIGVWCTAGQAWDWEALAFAYPDVTFAVGGVPDALPPLGFSKTTASWPVFLGEGHAVLCLPSDRIEDVWCSKAALFTGGVTGQVCILPHVILGPGYEACFFWPEGQLALFRRRRGAILAAPPL